MPAGAAIAYPAPPRAGLEHHLFLEDGLLELTIEGEVHRLKPGDCLRYRLHGASAFRATGERPASYILAIR
jgi:quercetin dioxygenase-like cupin family protein